MTTSLNSSGFVITDEKDASRYTLMRDGNLVSALDYRDDGSTIAMTRAYTVPTYRGHGYAAQIVEGAVADLAARGDRKVDAVQFYAAEFRIRQYVALGDFSTSWHFNFLLLFSWGMPMSIYRNTHLLGRFSIQTAYVP